MWATMAQICLADTVQDNLSRPGHLGAAAGGSDGARTVRPARPRTCAGTTWRRRCRRPGSRHAACPRRNDGSTGIPCRWPRSGAHARFARHGTFPPSRAPDRRHRGGTGAGRHRGGAALVGALPARRSSAGIGGARHVMERVPVAGGAERRARGDHPGADRLAQPAPEPFQCRDVRLAERRAAARRVERHQRAFPAIPQRHARHGHAATAGALRDGRCAGMERGDAGGSRGCAVWRAARERLDRDAQGLGPARAAACLCARPGGRAAGGRGGGVPHLDLGRRAAQHARCGDGRRAWRRGQRAGGARAGSGGIPAAHAALQRASRGTDRAPAGERGPRGAAGAGGTGPEPRPSRAPGGDGDRFRARDRHAAQYGEWPPAAAARRPAAGGAAGGGGPGAAAAGAGGSTRHDRAGPARSRRMARPDAQAD